MNHVLCDICNKDYTELSDIGGMIFGSYAVCPDCAGKMLSDIEQNDEAHYIHAVCPADMSFADFVNRWNAA